MPHSLAEWLGEADERQIALPAGVTCALNLAIWGVGLTLPRGAGVITSVAEHNSVLRPHAICSNGVTICN